MGQNATSLVSIFKCVCVCVCTYLNVELHRFTSYCAVLVTCFVVGKCVYLCFYSAEALCVSVTRANGQLGQVAVIAKVLENARGGYFKSAAHTLHVCVLFLEQTK